MIELRPYQEEALAKIAAAEQRGIRRQLGVAATGLGKTIVFAALAQRRPGRTLVLAHRDELVSQAKDKLKQVWPDADVGIVKAESDETGAHVVVASVQTLARQSRLDRLLTPTLGSSGSFDLVVVDEAHHSAADSYRRILDQVQSALVLGVTATPDRGDGQGLADLFDEITFEFDMLWGIRAGFLCDVRGLRVSVSQLDLSHVHVRRGDFDQGEVGALMEAADTEMWIHRAWEAHASDRQTLIFTPTVRMAELVAGEFAGHGVRAAWVSGGTPLDERRDILARYARGDLQVIANCAVLTEGYDDPRTDCIVVARPTKSRALFAQMIGRGTRRHPDKADLLVLDVVGATAQHSLVTIASLFGLEDEDARRMEEGERELSDVVQERDDRLVALGKLHAEEADLFRKMRETNDIAWVKVGEHAYDRGLGFKFQDDVKIDLGRVVLRLASTLHESWNASLVQKQPDGTTKIRHLAHEVDFAQAQGRAEDYIRKHGVRALTHSDAGWRGTSPSDKQLALAEKLGIAVPPDASKGDLSDLLDAEMGRRAEARQKRPVKPGRR